MGNFKQALKRTTAILMIAVLLIGIAPIGSLADVDWSEFALTASAATYGDLTYTVSNGKITITACKETATSVVIPSKIDGYPVTRIGEYAFMNCELTSVSIPSSVTTIGYEAFYGCDSLTSVSIPDSVTTIGDSAFGACKKLTSVSIPSSVTTIGDSAFSSCDLLTSFNVNKNNKNYSSDEYGVLFNKNKTKLIQYPAGNTRTSYVIPSSVTTIGNGAFYWCKKLANVTIPSSVTSIGDSAFLWCEKLTSVIIPGSVTSIGEEAFSWCTKLTNITVDKNNKNYSNDKYGVLFNKYKTKLIRYPEGNTRTSYVIPDSVTNIGYRAFYACTKLTSVTIPDGVTGIDDDAFWGCVSLTSVIIPKSVTSIGENAFKLSFVNTVYLSDVYYSGSKEQWEKISIESNSFGSKQPMIHYDGTWNKLSITPSSKTLTVGDTLQLNAVVSNVYKPNVKWSSSNTNVATVSATGKVTAKAAGEAVITAKTADAKNNSICNITVVTNYIPVKTFNITYQSVTISTNQIYQIYYNITPYNASNRDVIWKSSDSSVASVLNDVVIPIKPGTVTITGTTQDGQLTDSIVINIAKDTSSDELRTGTVDGIVFEFDSKWFFDDSVNYNHSISKLCSAFVTIGYKSKSTAKSALSKIGFSDIDIEKNAGRDEVNYFLASREIKVDGKKKLMIFTGYIGSHKLQWNSNFDPLATESKSANDHYSEKRGVVHLGFDDARYSVYQKLTDYTEDKQKELGYSDDDTVILVTGHSRGAATANLIGADLIRGATNERGYEKIANAKNIFTYTYATPNNTKSQDVKTSKFNRIFNIVNPEDFVTKVLPTAWNFSRYGQTYILPSRTNDLSNYKRYLTDVQTIFKELGNEDEYTPYVDGEYTVYNIVTDFTLHYSNVNQFYQIDPFNDGMSPFFYFQNVICPFVNKTSDQTPALALAGLLLTKSIPNIYSRLTWFFLGTNKLNDCFEDAHLPDTYYAFMTAMTEQEVVEGTKNRQKSLLYEVKCPVDITVFEKESGEIVAQITNNTINEEIAAKDNSLVVSVEGDAKRVWIPDPDAFEVVLNGNDNGTMDYTISTIESELGEISRANYFDVPVENDIVMMADVTETEDGVMFGSVYNEYGEQLADAEMLDTDELKQLNISVSANGYGVTSGDGVYTEGDYVTLTAQPDENNAFIGWYKNGELISTETEYSFVIKESEEFEAEFTDIFVEVTGVKIDSEKEITLIYGEENSVILEADILPSNSTIKTLAWESSDESVVTVDNFGIVTVVGVGSATVKVMTENAISDEITVNVICEHSFGEYMVTKQATCTENGEQTAVCSICTTTDIKIIPKKGHTYEAVVTVPTCTEGGYTTYTCTTCGDNYTGNETENLGHKGGTANCKDRSVCDICGESYGDINTNNHKNVITDKAVAATCTSTGLTEGSHCEACGEVFVVQISTAKLPHTEKTIKGYAPTCTAAGLSDGVKCSSCGTVLVKQATIKAIGHKDDNGDYMCDNNCGYLFEITDEPSTPDTSCSCNCHKDGFMGFIWKIICFFQKLFKTNQYCSCGTRHW